jgi:guanylate kinase
MHANVTAAPVQKGKMVVVSAPSGAGKTTIVQHLLNVEDLGLQFSVSACSRLKRHNEVDGKDYYFMSTGEFKRKIADGAFIEWEEVYPDHFYGTLKSEVERIWKNDRAVIFDVDVIGGLNIKRAFPDRTLALFIAPPSMKELEQRLNKRSTDNPESIRVRVQKAKKEMTFATQFDMQIINDDLEQALKETENAVRRFLTRS